MSGGGARAAYQVGLLKALAERAPDLSMDILTGVSAGAINTAYLANHRGSFAEAVDDLCRLWLELTTDDVFRTDWWSLFTRVLRSGFELVSGGHRVPGRSHGMVDTEPLRDLLHRELGTQSGLGEMTGIRANIAEGRIRAAAITTSSYSAGTSVTWVEGREIQPWHRAHRIGSACQLTVEHVMASTSLPLLFPAVPLLGEWHGDGGIRLSSPLSPAVHLGARRIIAVSTRYRPPPGTRVIPMIEAYPPPAQIAGSLLNAIFLDMFDGDALRLDRINSLLGAETSRNGVHRIELLLLRPSRDLGRLANDYEPRLPRGFRFLTRGLGTQETNSNDLLSLIMFQHDYLRELIDLGHSDARDRIDEILAFVGTNATGTSTPVSLPESMPASSRVSSS